MILSLKSKLYAFGAILLGFIGLILRSKYLAHKADKATHRAEVAEAGIRRKEAQEKLDAEIENEFSDRRRAAQNDEIPPNLRDPSDF